MTQSAGESVGDGTFSPYGRREPRALAITEADARLLAGAPAALRPRIPVVIEIPRPIKAPGPSAS